MHTLLLALALLTPALSAVAPSAALPDADAVPALHTLLRAPIPAGEYPEHARRWGVEGRVVVAFVVGADGRVRQARVERGLGYGCDGEALRIVRALQFAPRADVAGAPAERHYRIPVAFVLQGA